jgi:hypothetical protein
MRKIRSRWLLAATAAATVAVLVPATVRATIVDALTFQSAVDAAQAVDPTLQAPSNDGQHDFVVGGFTRANVEMSHTGFSAQSGPHGQAPSGHLSSTSDTGLKERYTVTCLVVDGQDAAIGLVPTDTPKSNTATQQVLAVHDGGPGGTLDTYAFYQDNANDCPQWLHECTFFTPLNGNILVHDEP